eukprot:TRINITY_DN3295_c0_g3_i1.p1 TRINITY_DN3295_c0_g3~~TRINITY_DN3295_c0_g3_i1.p1  ORF type:complete len:193 (-),score=65.31 TRINITY_DN3295_c0_g3_i1:26-604(-)
MQSIKCGVVGDGGIGKTCLLITYATNSFPEDYIPTVFDNYTVNVIFDEKLFSFGFYDTAGGEEYYRLRPLSYPQTNVFLVCFSIASPGSFESIQSLWIPEVVHHCPNTPILIIGLKSDLRDDQQTLEMLEKSNQTLITCEKGIELANDFNFKYLECSSLIGKGVKKIFEEAIKIVIFPINHSTQQKKNCLVC